MTILQRYIFRELLWTFLAVTVVLLIVLMGTFLGELLNDMADGRIPPGLLGTQMLLHIPEALGKILPMAAFVAVLWGLGRLYRDQEMVVMRSNGFGWRSLLKPLLTLCVPFAIGLLGLTFFVAPMASQKSEDTFEKAFKSAALWGLQAGRFHVLQSGNLVVYIEDLGEGGRGLKNVFVQHANPNNDVESIWSASRGEYWMDQDTGQRYLTLYDGQVTEGRPESRDMRVIRFERNDLRLPEPEREITKIRKEALPTSDLLQSTDPGYQAELQWRLAPAISILVLGLLAIPLAHSGPREGRGARIMLGVLAYALYANMLFLCRSWITNGVLPDWLGMWWVHGIVLASALLLLHRQGRMVGHG